MSEMSRRECFRATCRFENTGRFAQMEHGFWDETFERYRREGMPESVILPDFFKASRGDMFDYFHVLKCGYLRPYIYMNPPLETVVLEETDTSIVTRDGNGVTLRTSKTSASLPQELDFLIRDFDSYRQYRDHLTAPDIHDRYGDIIAEAIEGYRNQQDYAAVCTHMDGFFAYPRGLMGVVNMMYQFYDDPDFMHTLLNDRAEFYIKVYEPILQQIKPDYAFIWEDMCFKNGPLVSPAIFEEFMLPAYRKVISFLHDFGVTNVIVDSDGDVTKLLPLWLKAGVTGLLPFEVQAGMDVVRLGEEFPDLIICGGINKLAMFGGKAEIDEELKRVLPAMARRGGYIPSLDHWVPPEISLESFTYYCEKVQSFRW